MKNIIYTFSLILVSLVAIPVFAYQPKNFAELINGVFIDRLLLPILPLLSLLGLVVFIYGVLILMFSDGGEKKEEGKQYMVWGIVGLFVMGSVWGLVEILRSTFQLDNSPHKIEITLPQ